MKKLTINLINLFPFVLSLLLLVMRKVLAPDIIYEDTIIEQGFLYSFLSLAFLSLGILIIIFRMLLFSYKKFPFKIFEFINLILSLVILCLPLITKNNNFLYGGISFILATTFSIFIIRILPLNFENIEINILQFHIFICIFLGTNLNFYTLVHEFDFFLHLNFGIVACILSLPFIRTFTSKLNIEDKKSFLPFIILVIFCFSVSLGAIWEIYEFSVDHLLSLKTQNGSLIDTMWDIIANTIGAILFCIIYFLKNKKQAK